MATCRSDIKLPRDSVEFDLDFLFIDLTYSSCFLFVCLFVCLFVRLFFPPSLNTGSNSTVTPGVHTTGVVFSSLGVSPLLLVLIILACVFGLATCIFCKDNPKSWMNEWIDVPKEWFPDVRSRIQTTEG